MTFPARSALFQTALMALLSALLFVVFFRLNDNFFSFLEYTEGVNWVFLPAGFRVVLVLVFGLAGAFGIALGTLWLDLNSQDLMPPWQMALISLTSGFVPWLIKVWMQRRDQLHPDLSTLNAGVLLQFVGLYAVLNAIVHQTIRWVFDGSESHLLLHVWPMFIGDVIGALVVLYAFKLMLPVISLLLRRRF